MRNIALDVAIQTALLTCVVPQVTLSQASQQNSIRVESRLVVVPVSVLDKKGLGQIPTEEQKACDRNETALFASLPPTEPFIPRVCYGAQVLGLAIRDFQISVDGTEQKVQRLTTERMTTLIRDNRGANLEYSVTPLGIWSGADQPVRRPTQMGEGLFLYNLAFVPDKSVSGGCHKIEVTVDRPNSVVAARPEYCGSQSPTDTLDGTTFGKKLEEKLTSRKRGKINVSLQAGFFYVDRDRARVEVSLEFPSEVLHRQWGNDRKLYADIGILGTLSKKDQDLAARFSDFACCSSYLTAFTFGRGPGFDFVPNDHGSDAQELQSYFVQTWLNRVAQAVLPTRFETQLEVVPGEYDLAVVLSDDKEFGRAETHLKIDSYDGKGLGLSSLILCNRFRDAHVAATEAAAANIAPQYVPLVSKGIQVTPTGDSRFKRGEPLIAYFEVYEPSPAEQLAGVVQTHLRITNAKSGETLKDLGQVDVKPYQRPGTTTYAVAREIPIEKLSKGTYRLEAQAIDSAGRSTASRSANFTVE